MAFGVYGKHPAKGDFVEYGVPPALLRVLEGWLDKALAEARESLGPAWEQVWPEAPHLCFWLGEAIWGEPVAGVLAPSRDRVGRRFPLVWLASGADVPPPPVNGVAPDWWAALSVHAAATLARAEVAQPAALLEGAPRPMGEGVAGVAAPEFWAARPGGDVAGLWGDVTLADHRQAAAGRSYWWVAGDAVTVAAVQPVSGELSAEEAAPPAEMPQEADADPSSDVAPLDPAPPDPVPSEAEAAEVMIEPEEGQGQVAAPADEDIWALVGVAEEDEGSPFDPAPGGLGLFAAPQPAASQPAEAEVAAPVADTVVRQLPAARLPRASQIWAGAGLPGGAVLAWFFRGHAGNG